MKKQLLNKAFTLAETLIVIGIIGVVAALTLPNLNHATGDKEKVTRVKKMFSAITEANDRAVATYGPISEWSEDCRDNLDICWMKRVGEFMKITKSCEVGDDEEKDACEVYRNYYDESLDMDQRIMYQLADGSVFATRPTRYSSDCSNTIGNHNDICLSEISIDIDGPSKGKNELGNDLFLFMVSDRLGVMPAYLFTDDPAEQAAACIEVKWACTYWAIENGNLDYLKADSTGKCNDSNIVLNGVTNTSCH